MLAGAGVGESAGNASIFRAGASPHDRVIAASFAGKICSALARWNENGGDESFDRRREQQ